MSAVSAARFSKGRGQVTKGLWGKLSSVTQSLLVIPLKTSTHNTASVDEKTGNAIQVSVERGYH